ncbi:hypothetical protein D3C72_1609470 [compost metagenome]
MARQRGDIARPVRRSARRRLYWQCSHSWTLGGSCRRGGSAEARGSHPPHPHRPRVDHALLRQAAHGEEGGLFIRHRSHAAQDRRHAPTPRRPRCRTCARCSVIGGRRPANPRRRLRARAARAGDTGRPTRACQWPSGVRRRHERPRSLPRRQARAAQARRADARGRRRTCGSCR